ncbi:uncharacterized protein LOC107363652 [Tetranychus urticae]|uniref:uncharacterized protein LOC107363652 n=1 Tax=Tetranychus urticae TaxID=32264 RepID=UPI00077B986D|nr:uncharacterized protein LOC107363652 [Tetranychus urticae]
MLMFILSVFISIVWLIQPASGYVTLFAPFNAIGLRGNITFRQESNESEVTVAINLLPVTLREKSIDYQWAIMSFPYFLGSPCRPETLGKLEYNMTTKHGPIQVVPVNLGGQVFTDGELSLHGRKSIWSSSIIITDGKHYGCTNIRHESDTKTAKAQFYAPFAGTVVFRENELGDTVIMSNLFYIGSEFRVNSQHDWKILVTDILDSRPNTDSKCHYLTTLLDPDNTDDSQCTERNHGNCKIGDLSRKHGQVTVYKANNRGAKQKFIDTNLPLSIFDSTRSSYIVIYEKNNPSRPISCGLITPVKKKEVKAMIDMDGVKGYIGFSQAFHTDPTIVTVKLDNLRGRGLFYKIYSFPISPVLSKEKSSACSNFVTGDSYNPFRVNSNSSPKPGKGTQDQYEVGDLSGKYGGLVEDQNGHVTQIHVDLNLPLFGRHSIIGRSLVIHKIDDSNWICATIGYPGPVVTAVATFYFPVAGRIIFRQEADQPTSEATVFADLSYSDGTYNDTTDFPWHIHTNPPNNDFYSWKDRCNSTGPHYDPFSVGHSSYDTFCTPDNPFRCELGDLAKKSGLKMSIAGYSGSKQVKLFYTDEFLPLSGAYSIIGKSIVVHDINGPVQRGNRLACTPIKKLHPMTASVRSWRFGGDKAKVSGSITFHHVNPFDATHTKIELHGLDKQASGFHVHEVSVPEDREFPCSNDSVYGHFNPLGVDSRITHYPGVGSSDQYEIGDLSGKVGTLQGKDSWRHSYWDSNLPLFWLNSIIGRSVVIHKATRDERWVCGSIVPEVKKSEAREIVALATFDDPKHLINGFVRFRQFEYKDGSTSDTFLEVDLKHKGNYNRNITKGHRWSVFVNQVGADAFQTVESVRCVASGYIWNPYQTDSNKFPDLYKRHCTPTNPLRCVLGDLSGRNGPLIIGGKRRVITDVNLPLVGNASVVGRSLIIYHKDESDTKMACANILADFHLHQTFMISSNPTFTVAKFMDHMRSQLKTTDWLIKVDNQETKLVFDGECISLGVNFYGPNAYRLKEEFGNLLNYGSVHKNSQGGVVRLSTSYTVCKPVISGSINVLPNFNLILILIGSIGLVILRKDFF